MGTSPTIKYLTCTESEIMISLILQWFCWMEHLTSLCKPSKTCFLLHEGLPTGKQYLSITGSYLLSLGALLTFIPRTSLELRFLLVPWLPVLFLLLGSQWFKFSLTQWGFWLWLFLHLWFPSHIVCIILKFLKARKLSFPSFGCDWS